MICSSMHENIRRLRELQALSQRDLANRAQLSLTTICRVENGQCKPMPRTVRKLAKALGVTPDTLLSGQPRLMQ